MASFLKPSLLVAAIGIAINAGGDAGAGQASVNHVAGTPTGKYIFVLRDDGGSDASKAALRAAGNPGNRLLHVFSGSINGFSLETSAERAAEVASTTPDIAFYEADVAVSLYDSFRETSQAPVERGSGEQVIPWGIARVGACVKGKCGMPASVGTPWIWVIDSGIADHPDLNVNRTYAFSSVGEGGIDGHGHGTHVSGTIAAKNDGAGVVGVAPGAVVVPVQVITHDNQGSIETIIAGVDHVAQQRINCAHTIGCEPQKWVANMSLTTPPSAALDLAVRRASRLGIRFAIAAGNEAKPARNFSPARVNGRNIFTVSASCGPVMPECAGGKDYLTSFSDFGTPPVDYAAPGDQVLSTWLNGGYMAGAGTSMASPHVAGLLARLPGLTSDRIGKHFCGRVRGDKDWWREPIAFVYAPDSSRCKLARSTPAAPPPAQ